MPRRGLAPMRYASVPWRILEQEQGGLDSDGSWQLGKTAKDWKRADDPHGAIMCKWSGQGAFQCHANLQFQLPRKSCLG